MYLSFLENIQLFVSFLVFCPIINDEVAFKISSRLFLFLSFQFACLFAAVFSLLGEKNVLSQRFFPRGKNPATVKTAVKRQTTSKWKRQENLC